MTAELAIRAEAPPIVSEVLILPDTDDDVITVDADGDILTLRSVIRFTNGEELDVTEQSDWESTGDQGALDLSDSAGSRGRVTINGVGEITVTMTHDRDDIRYIDTVTVQSTNF